MCYSCSLLALRTELEAERRYERVGQGMSRERGALGVAVRARRSPYLHRRPVTRSQQPKRREGGAGHRDCGSCRRCFSSACPRHCSSPRAAARSSNLTQRPSATRGCRSPGEPGRAEKGRRRTRRTQEALPMKKRRHRALRLRNAKGGPQGTRTGFYFTYYDKVHSATIKPMVYRTYVRDVS